jgi:hypothetical protein
MDSESLIQSNNTQEILVNFKYGVKFNLNEDSKLSDLKNLINKEFMINDEEYEIFIKDMQLLIINQELKIKTLIDSNQTNEFTVKSFKSKIFGIIYPVFIIN